MRAAHVKVIRVDEVSPLDAVGDEEEDAGIAEVGAEGHVRVQTGPI